MRTENTDDLAGRALERFMGEDKRKLTMFTDPEYHKLREAILWAVTASLADGRKDGIEEAEQAILAQKREWASGAYEAQQAIQGAAEAVRKLKDTALKVEYKGFEISARREQSLGGWDNLYFHIMRLSDGWFMEDSFTEGDDEIEDFIGHLKKRVDAYCDDPTQECAGHGEGYACLACLEQRPTKDI